ncbi:DsbA family oxidoreductase [Alsobacter sp. SYSU M60028]|uniref:DsbA family oxidoreductase n=1 Tax=Alsobacter ponti TaxID=2962936 RepID=A0ABT1LI13_9HYPH|nr:DsbA family oxidoreductase [Alsobacter ponti]MCP8940736.1 DsbA family oxidoreductase [Alsobacter ponti]
MSDASLKEPRIVVDVVSDVVCPWCFVGKRRLGQALASRPDLAVAVRWRPFQLDGTIPPGGLDRQDYMRGKFGSLDRVASVHRRLEEIGATEGIPFRFDAIERSPNTLDAHRLIRAAQEAGVGEAVVEALFKAYFVEGRDIGDHAVLAEIAGQAGLDRDQAAALLASDALSDSVAQEIDAAQRIGVTGVPFFIFNGKYAVSGAESPDVLASALDRCEEDAEG